MGNFQHLAEQILIKNCHTQKKVSCFLSLVGETGNFEYKNRNFNGNFFGAKSRDTQCEIAKEEETYKEAYRKQVEIIEEITNPQTIPKSFLVESNNPDIFEQFFAKSNFLKMELLADDKRWIKAICFGVSISNLVILLNEYIECWCNAMKLELISYKKQNTGRYAANRFIRQALINEHKN